MFYIPGSGQGSKWNHGRIMSHGVGEGVKVLGSKENVWKKNVFIKQKWVSEGTIVPMMLYGCEAWNTYGDVEVGGCVETSDDNM